MWDRPRQARREVAALYARVPAAHPIPGDRTSWGAFEMLDERSTAVQHQLAEQAAADASASGVEKLVGDFWATGMDEA